MFYIFHGDDAFSLSEEVARLREILAGGDPVMGDLNTTLLEGSQVTLAELRHACDTVPFMAERRLVIVHALLSRLVPRKSGGPTTDSKPSKPSTAGDAPPAKQDLLNQLTDYLPHLPSTTRLIFVEEETLADSHPILELARVEHEHGRAHIRRYQLPKEEGLPGWIRQRAEEKGGTISSEAVSLLAALVGTDLRLLEQEIEKLLLYADGRQVTSNDVAALVSCARETSMFDLVDCVGRRQAGQALQLLHRLLDEGVAPLILLAMLARQIRILIQIAELQEQQLSPKEMVDRLRLHPFVVKKGLAQGRNFALTQLEAAHDRLIQADWSIKTGDADDVLALDMLVIALTQI